MNEEIEGVKVMKSFFEKYPIELKESIALKMILDKIESSSEKCEKRNQDYIDDAAMAFQMLQDFFIEKNIDPLIY